MNQTKRKTAPVTVNKLIQRGKEILEGYQKPQAAVDARLLALYLLKCSPAKLLLLGEEQVADHIAQSYLYMVVKRAQGMPLQYITKEQNFMGHDFYVDERVLIPRQDTEVLVDTLIQYGKTKPFRHAVEIGVGSGCISISLALAFPNLQVTALDICGRALEVAKKNVMTHQVEERVTLLESDVFSAYKGEPESLDLVVSNPPYITAAECKTLMQEVKGYEPRHALTDEGDGLRFYRTITKEAGYWLKSGGVLAYEIGCEQGMAVHQLLSDAGYENVQVIKDLAGKDRIVMGNKK